MSGSGGGGGFFHRTISRCRLHVFSYTRATGADDTRTPDATGGSSAVQSDAADVFHLLPMSPRPPPV